MLEQSKLWIEFLAVGVEVAAAVVIGLASLEAITRALPLFVRRSLPQDAKVVYGSRWGGGWRWGSNLRWRRTSCAQRSPQAGVR